VTIYFDLSIYFENISNAENIGEIYHIFNYLNIYFELRIEDNPHRHLEMDIQQIKTAIMHSQK
jgi:hypothetical protein